MAGEGFIKHALTSQKENKKLLRRKSLFKKERTFLNLENKVFYNFESGIESKNLTKDQLEEYSNKAKAFQHKENFRIAIISFVGIFLFIVGVTWYYQSTVEAEKASLFADQRTAHQKDLDRYNYLISSGDEWLEKEKYHNAIFQYNLALEVFPKDSLVIFRLIDATELNCKVNNNNCGESDTLMDRYLKD